MNDLRAVRGRAYPRVSGLFREKSWLFFEILLPFLTTSAFVFVYRALQAPPEYIGFVVLGGAMTAFWLNVVWMMAAQLFWEKDQGNLELYFAAPMDVMSVLLGMALGGMVMSSTRALVVLVVATVVYGVSFQIDQWALLLAVFGLTLTALYGLGMILASLFLMWGREAWHTTQLMVEPVYFVSGLNFPVAKLGFIGALAVATIPLAVGLDAMRQLAFVETDVSLLPPVVEAGILVVMTLVFTAIARWSLRTLERRARIEGRLTMRWQ
jgi:ABC-2 type transport system permease protein